MLALNTNPSIIDQTSNLNNYLWSERGMKKGGSGCSAAFHYFRNFGGIVNISEYVF